MMKTNREIINQLKACVDASDVPQIHEILGFNASRIPYIEIELLDHAIEKYVSDFDPLPIRALIDAGCNPFAALTNVIVPDPRVQYHALTSPYDLLEDAWVGDNDGKPREEFALLLKYILGPCLERHKEIFAGQSIYADRLIDRAEGLRTEVEARLAMGPEGYENYIDQRLKLGLD